MKKTNWKEKARKPHHLLLHQFGAVKELSLKKMMNQRRKTATAIRPPKAPSRSIGRNWSAVVTPTATPLPVSERITQISATICIQLPDTETSCPAK